MNGSVESIKAIVDGLNAANLDGVNGELSQRVEWGEGVGDVVAGAAWELESGEGLLETVQDVSMDAGRTLAALGVFLSPGNELACFFMPSHLSQPHFLHTTVTYVTAC